VANPDYGLTVTEYEANLIQARLLKKGFSILRMERENATSRAIIEHMHNCSLLHFCGHAVSNFYSPLESYLEVACKDENTGNDLPTLWENKFLRAKRIMAEGTIQPGAWVILSACESGASPPDPSGESVGLPAAFLAAGAATVISTLWAVQAGISLMFMDRFYDNIFEKKLSVPAALREATVYLRNLTLDDIERFEDSPELSESNYIVLTSNEAKDFSPNHPVHWAPYVVCGATWSVSEVPSNRLEIGSHQQKLAELSTHIGAGWHPKLGEVLKEAEGLFYQKQYLQMVSKLEEASKDYELSGPLHEGLGNAYAELKNFDKACHHYREVLRYDPNSSSNHYNLGCVYRDFGHITEAKECFQHGLHLNPAYANALINLAELTNDPQEALQYLNHALLIDPEDKVAQGGMRMWQKLSGEDRASIVLHRLNWAEQDLDKGNFLQARLHLALTRQESIDDITKAMAFRIESDIFRKEGNVEGSITALESAVELDTTHPTYWNTLAARRLLLINEPQKNAMLSVSDGKRSMLCKAEQECLKALSLSDYSKPHQNLALIYLNLGQMDKAKEHAILARNIAQRQMDAKTDIICNGCPVAICSSGGCKNSQTKIFCKICPIEGKMPTECQECLRKAHGILRDIELVSGDYKVEGVFI
jgi:tetratricopeptide (TPR) repeat protein